jgi:hypothetical protein
MTVFERTRCQISLKTSEGVQRCELKVNTHILYNETKFLTSSPSGKKMCMGSEIPVS